MPNMNFVKVLICINDTYLSRMLYEMIFKNLRCDSILYSSFRGHTSYLTSSHQPFYVDSDFTF